MADVRCPRCTEPIDIDAFHDIAEDRGETFDQVWAEFRRTGCRVIDGIPCRVSPRAYLVDALTEVFGDDIDGLAGDLADAEALGLI